MGSTTGSADTPGNSSTAGVAAAAVGTITTDTADCSAPAPFLHADTGAVRFWVPVAGGGWVGATVSKEALHYRFRAQINGSDAVAVYQSNLTEINDAVRRRVARGSIEPVMLREVDLAAPPVTRG